MNLPQSINSLLEGEKICFLATSQEDQPHLSMMNFTYLPAEELIILSTRRNTRKFFNMQKNSAVALLVYRMPLSCTILGRAKIEEGEQAEHYRALHLARHKNMRQFISGPEIAVVTVRIEQAMTADLQDEVYSWQPKHP
jgi:nitroimidazol reductase NimA-like FMN-containing flavoprotein (pyridoxamine 5'-phosphate oxidase superfamily)